MSPKDAKAVARLMRRQHGDYAERFVASQIKHFQQETASADAVEAWRLVEQVLAGEVIAQRSRITAPISKVFNPIEGVRPEQASY